VRVVEGAHSAHGASALGQHLAERAGRFGRDVLNGENVGGA